MGMSIEELQRVIESVYEGRLIDDVLSFGCRPKLAPCVARIFAALTVHRPLGGTAVVVLSVIDNLVKGAAGLAVQNKSVIFGFAESEGLWQLPVLP